MKFPRFRNYDVDPDLIVSIIGHHPNAPPFANIVSSDLDADRIDYLLRTSQHTGLPYGHIDLEYLMTMIRVDSSEKICIDNRGMRTAEHLLLARYFDYQQVSYHKTVQGFERLLEDVLQVLVTDGLLDCSVQRLEEMAKNPFEWAAFDDASVTDQIREYAREHPETDDGLKARALVTRSGPKQVYSTEFFSEREANRQSLADKKALLKLAAEGVAAELAFSAISVLDLGQ